MKRKTRISREEFQKRMLELESLYGQKELSKKLGISRDSAKRYRQGATFPQSRETYNKINRLYNRKKNLINPEIVEKKAEKIKKKTLAEREGRIKTRYASIEEYLSFSPIHDYLEVKGIEKIYNLSDEGYIVAWKGRKSIPLEVMFTLGKESLSIFGKVFNIIGIVARMNSPKTGSKYDEIYNGVTDEIIVVPTYFRTVKGLNNGTSYEKRMDLLRDHFLNMQFERGFGNIFIGYYFNEGDTD